MTGQARASLLIGWIGRAAAGIAHGRRIDARRLPELALRTPEAAKPEDCLPQPGRKRTLKRMAIDEMLGRHRHLLAAAGQGLFGGRDGQLAGKQFGKHFPFSSCLTCCAQYWAPTLACHRAKRPGHDFMSPSDNARTA